MKTSNRSGLPILMHWNLTDVADKKVSSPSVLLFTVFSETD